MQSLNLAHDRRVALSNVRSHETRQLLHYPGSRDGDRTGLQKQRIRNAVTVDRCRTDNE